MLNIGDKMNYNQLIKIVREINGNHSEFECLISIFTLNLFDKTSLKQFSGQYLSSYSNNSDNALLYFLKSYKVKEYLYNNYDKSIIDILDKYFSSFSITLQLLREVVSLTLNIKILPSTYDTFSYFLDDKYFNISEQIIELCCKLIDEKSESIYVPFKNGIKVSKFTSKEIYCEDINPNIELIELFLSLYEKKKLKLNITDSLKKPSFHECNNLKQFDTVIAFPPFSLMDNLDRFDKYNRFKIHSGKRLDVACFEHVLSQTQNEAIVLMPVGFSFRSGVEEKFREFLIENNYLKALIQLPSSIHTGNSIESSIYVIDKHKKDNNVVFFNLKNQKFLSKNGRQTILKDIDEIINLYETRALTKDINIVSNQEIKDNNYNLSIDRYILSKEANKIKDKLSRYNLVKIEKIAEVRKCQIIKEYEEGVEVCELAPTELDIVGFSKEGKKVKKVNIHTKQFDSYSLRPFDILLSAKGVIGKVGIVGEDVEYLLASQAIQRIRLDQTKDLKKDAIALYMYLKSDIGQKLLSELLVQGTVMKQISTNDIKEFEVPSLSEEQKDRLIENFEEEVSINEEIKQLQKKMSLINKNFLEDRG